MDKYFLVFDQTGCFKYWVKTRGGFDREENDLVVESSVEQIEALQGDFWRLMYDGQRVYVDEAKTLPVDCSTCNGK